MKLAVVYHSESGNTKQAAEMVKAGMEKVEGVTADCYSITEASPEVLADYVGIAFGAPTYYAQMSWQMFRYIENVKLNLADKLGCAFATANFAQGGSELVLQNLNTLMLAKGMTVYSGGTSHGTPFTHTGANALAKEPDGLEAKRAVLEALGAKFAAKAVEYFAK